MDWGIRAGTAQNSGKDKETRGEREGPEQAGGGRRGEVGVRRCKIQRAWVLRS